MVTLPDFLTEEQIKQAVEIYTRALTSGEMCAPIICREVIEPNMEEINRKLGQENDAMYLAYMCEYALVRSHQTEG